MAEDVNNTVKIISWPEKNKAMLEHSFNSEKPCPVSIVFDSPATIKFDTNPKEPLHVDMNMQLRTESVPVTFRLAEALCARSDYAVGIQFFDHHVATIRLAGLTKLFNCNDEKGLCDVSGLAASAAIPEVKPPVETPTHRTVEPS